MAKTKTDPDVRAEAQVVLADLFCHIAGRTLTPHNPPKLPTRLKKLEGLDGMAPGAAQEMLTAAPLLAALVISALDAAGYYVEVG